MGCGCCGCGTTGRKAGKGGWMAAVGAMVALTGSGVAILGGAGQQHKEEKAPPAAAVPAKTGGAAQPAASAPTSEKEAKSVYDFTMKRIDGKEESLSVYKGKVALIVNVATHCGLTPQYEPLQKLYTAKKDQGFVVLGFPANDFKDQEPGTNSEIATFCSTTYGVNFPMFEKITVVGKDAHPLYKFIASQPQPIGQEPTWNFTKYLVDREGKVVARFDPKMKPDDPAIVAKIDELLKAGGEKK